MTVIARPQAVAIHIKKDLYATKHKGLVIIINKILFSKNTDNLCLVLSIKNFLTLFRALKKKANFSKELKMWTCFVYR
jgi:hypothetical protein